MPVLILNTGNHSHFFPNARRSIEHACKRWGEDLYVFTQGLGGRSPMEDKMRLWLWAAEQKLDPVLVMDRDLVIRQDCPNLLDFHTDEGISVVTDRQPSYDGDMWGDHGYDGLRWWCTRVGCLPPERTHSPNAGVVAFNPVIMRQHVEWLLEVAQPLLAHGIGFIDQAGLWLMHAVRGVPINWWPLTFNRVNIDNKTGHQFDWSTGPMREYVYHFAASPDQCVEWVDWKNIPDDPTLVPELGDNGLDGRVRQLRT